MIRCHCLIASLILASSLLHAADEAPKLDPRYPFRTDFANAQLPWYQPKPLEFPPHHSDRRISGELVSADFVHRTGQFRMSKTGELVDFTMPPYGAINYLNAEADLRDVPLGTFFLFFLNQDSRGGFTRLATMQDQFTMDMGHSFTYRLDEAKLGEGKLLTTKHSISKKQDDLGKKELIVAKETRYWKGDKQVKAEDLKPGDELLFNITGKSGDSQGWCTDIWIGVDTHQLTKDTQQNKFNAFIKHRGLPGWIEKAEGKNVTLTLFSGDTAAYKKAWADDLVKGKETKLLVTNDELRTWNPPVDGERGSILVVQKVPTECYGCSGFRITVSVSNMLEGFRKGRVARVLIGGWPVKDQFYGESLMGYGFGRMQNQELVENPAKEYPEQYPFRTEFGNEQLAWYQIKPGQEPPPASEHVVYGEITKINEDNRSGQFRMDRTGDSVDFTLIEKASVRHLNTDAPLSDIAVGTRCRFHLYEDEKGAFTKASLVSDEFSYLASNFITWRVSTLKLNDGKIYAERQIPLVKDYNGDMQRPPDVGRTELRVTNETRVWKGDKAVKLSDLAVGDALLVNLSGELPDKPSRCTDIWIGEDTHKLVTDQETAKNKPKGKVTKAK